MHSFGVAACAASFSMFVNNVGAATLHWPLPADSTAQNGTVQKLAKHKLATGTPKVVAETPLHPHAEAGLKRKYTGTPIDVLNYHYDTYPTGWNQGETDLTPATVQSSSFGKLKTLEVDGNVFAQPLMVSNFTMPDGSVHNVLIIATGHNTLYAYDAEDYSVLWKVSLGKPQISSDVGCGDVEPEYGISSTPVIVRSGTAANDLCRFGERAGRNVVSYEVACGRPRHRAGHHAATGDRPAKKTAWRQHFAF